MWSIVFIRIFPFCSPAKISQCPSHSLALASINRRLTSSVSLSLYLGGSMQSMITASKEDLSSLDVQSSKLPSRDRPLESSSFLSSSNSFCSDLMANLPHRLWYTKATRVLEIHVAHTATLCIGEACVLQQEARSQGTARDRIQLDRLFAECNRSRQCSIVECRKPHRRVHDSHGIVLVHSNVSTHGRRANRSAFELLENLAQTLDDCKLAPNQQVGRISLYAWLPLSNTLPQAYSLSRASM